MMTQYTLKFNGNIANVNALGGELTSFVSQGQEYIWQGDPAVWGSHSPVLFPVVCTPKDGKIVAGGREYPMEKHGFARKSEFKLYRRGEDFIDLVFEADAETMVSYPFDFALHVVHTLMADGFSTNFIVENRSDTVMPFCIGGHPGFVCPMRPGELFEDYVIKFEHVESGENSTAPGGGLLSGTEFLPNFRDSDTLALDYELFDTRDALIFAGLMSRRVDLMHKNTGAGITFEFPKFEALGIWTAPGKHAPYVCLEPWSGLPASVSESGRFEEKRYAKYLNPGQSYITGYTMTVKPS